eukprot:c44120_g1_i1 orf=453-695(+)
MEEGTMAPSKGSTSTGGMAEIRRSTGTQGREWNEKNGVFNSKGGRDRRSKGAQGEGVDCAQWDHCPKGRREGVEMGGRKN